MRHLRQVCVWQGLEAGKWLLPSASQLRFRVTTLIWATGVFPQLLSLKQNHVMELGAGHGEKYLVWYLCS